MYYSLVKSIFILTLVLSSPSFSYAQTNDNDNDGIVDSLDPDDDNDGLIDDNDNCPLISNPSQVDFNNNGEGEFCEKKPVLVKEINRNPYYGRSDIISLVDFNGLLVFAGDNGRNGVELWKSDGTRGGTHMIKNINTDFDFYNGGSSDPHGFTIVGDQLFFAAYHADNGTELWKTDGTEVGTVLVKDIIPGSSSSSPTNLINLQGTIYFSTRSETGVIELWKSDGSESGTKFIKLINPSGNYYAIDHFTNVDGILYFSADDGIHGSELWRSNGTQVGTYLVKEITPGVDGADLNYFINIDDMLYFSADDGQSGIELWKSDGSESGTLRVKDINPGGNSARVSALIDVNGTLFFNADDGVHGLELYKSDGTESGTVMVKDINSGTTGTGSGVSASLPRVSLNGMLYFPGFDGVHRTQLWKSDGTESGTQRVTNLYPGSSDWHNFYYLTNVGDSLYFSANDVSHGLELYKSDGTASGTVKMTNHYLGTGKGYPWDYNPMRMIGVGDQLFYTIFDDEGEVLWKTDGTEEGTMFIKDVDPSTLGSNPYPLAKFKNDLYFHAGGIPLGSPGKMLWKTDSTPLGTENIKETRQGENIIYPAFLTDVNDTLFFGARSDAYGYELFKSQGTASTTTLVKDINPGNVSSGVRNFLEVNNVLYFNANDGVHGRELWKSDGSAIGTVQIKDINSGSFDADPYELTNINDTLYFAAFDGTNAGIWKSEGTLATTVKVKDIYSSFDRYKKSPRALTNLNGTLYFIADDPTGTIGLWRSDGTQAGTTIVKNFDTDNRHAQKYNFRSVNGTILFSMTDSMHGRELWKTDGTASGTVLVKDINPGSASSNLFEFTVFNNSLYFFADDGITGKELWKSDGTSSGTIQVKDINPGSDDAIYYFAKLIIHDDSLYFEAYDGNSRYELYTSDGTESGTVKVTNQSIDMPDINFEYLTSVNDTLYFVGDNLRYYLKFPDLHEDALDMDDYELWMLATNPIITHVGTVNDTADGMLSEDETTSSSISEINLSLSHEFNDDGDGTNLTDISHSNHYILAEAGANGSFSTADCSIGIEGDDIAMPITNITYTPWVGSGKITINLASPLPGGNYRLIVCASIVDIEGFNLDGNADGVRGDNFIRNFNVAKDSDGDGVLDHLDNCPNILNTDQSDTDNDGVGDACNPASSIQLPHDSWVQISMPGEAVNNTVSDLFAEILTIADYNRTWVVFGYNETANRYNRLNVNSPIKPGPAYWINQRTGASVKFNINATPTPVVAQTTNPNCPSVSGCFEIELVAPGVNASTGWNMIGHPFFAPVHWNDIRLEVDGNRVCSPAQASNANLLRDVYWHFNGLNYEIRSSTSPPDGSAIFTGYKGYWIQVHPSAVGHSMKLLIPKGIVTDNPSCLASP